jgi:hypothetical protein
VDIKADISTVTDRGEAASLIEPLLLTATSKHRGPLTDLALELAAQLARLRGSLPKHVDHSCLLLQ